jgi:rhodanese-related sulfurtransferase
MSKVSNALAFKPAESHSANTFFTNKLGFETDCSDVYADIKSGAKNYVLMDVRSKEAFDKSHAITAISFPHMNINEHSFSEFEAGTVFVVYCWGPGCNGATKAAMKISALGFPVKEMIGGIQYWEDFERYPVNRNQADVQV